MAGGQQTRRVAGGGRLGEGELQGGREDIQLEEDVIRGAGQSVVKCQGVGCVMLSSVDGLVGLKAG